MHGQEKDRPARIRPARRGTAPHPALVLLHGRGADENDLFSLSAALDERLVVVSPRAPLPLMGGYMWYRDNGRGVPAEEDMRAGLRMVEGLLDGLPGAHGVDPARLFVLGFSQGAAMTGALLLSAPHRLAGALVLSGYVPPMPALQPGQGRLAGTPVFVAHGTHDPVVPVQWGRAAGDALAAAGAAVTYREYPGGHGITPQGLEDLAAWLTDRLDGRTPENASPAR
ncbi:MAG: alpha/beta fold hydrolase [Chloroflexota bacterium]